MAEVTLFFKYAYENPKKRCNFASLLNAWKKFNKQ